ncbi:MAG: CPBP family intramembrane glutamic endopeptidase, partial [Myxococcota bacterium]
GPLGALLLSNALFSLFYIHYSVPTALATFVFGLYFGAVWMRHRSLLAVTVAHCMVGMWAIEVLGALPLLGIASH